MNAIFEIESTITERGQTTVPSAIRKMLGVAKSGKVVFRGMEDGTVVIAPRQTGDEHEDPALAGFLSFLARDLALRPKEIAAGRQDLLDRANALVEDMQVDLDEPLKDE